MYMKRLVLILVIVALLAMFLMFLMSGCTRTIRSVERGDTVWVERHTTDTLFVQSGASDTLLRASCDTVRVADVRHDTLTIRDSVFVRERNDTTFFVHHVNDGLSRLVGQLVGQLVDVITHSHSQEICF